MADSEIRALERRVAAGDEGALPQLTRELERRGDFEDLLARLWALLNAAQDQSRGVRLRGEITVCHVVEALRAVIRLDLPADDRPRRLVLRRELLPAQRSPQWSFQHAYAAVALEGSDVRIATGRGEPDALAAFDRELEAPGGGVSSIFSVSERASFSTPPEQQLVLSRATALAWARWCESDPRAQPRDQRVDGVRLRPAMYIGDTHTRGLHLLAEQCFLDVVNEYAEGTLTGATISLGTDGALEVSDNGVGVPAAAPDGQGLSPLVNCYTNLEATWGRLRQVRAREFYPGLMGVGAACVNFLSAWFEVESAREGELWLQRFEQGQPSSRLVSLGRTDRHGTRVRFLPDPTIFTFPRFDFVALGSRLEELAYLHPRLELRLVEAASGRSVLYRSERGLVDLVSKTMEGERAIAEPIFSVSGSLDSAPSGGAVHVDAALSWTHGDAERTHSFVNGGPTMNGGTHVAGLHDALAALFEDPVARSLLPAAVRVPSGEALRLGLNAAIAVRLPGPQFEGSTKARLGSPDVRRVVREVITPALLAFVQGHPRLVKALALRAGRSR